MPYGFENGYPMHTKWDVGMGDSLSSGWTTPYFISTASYNFDIFRKITVQTWGIRRGSISSGSSGQDKYFSLGITDGTRIASRHSVLARKRGFNETNSDGSTWIGRTTVINVPSTVTGVKKLAFYSMHFYYFTALPYSVVLSKA